MPGPSGQKYEKKRRTSVGTSFDNEPLLTIPGPRRSVQGTPQQAVNRTSKADKSDRQSTHYKNQRHDPVPRIQGSDDMPMLEYTLSKRRKQRV